MKTNAGTSDTYDEPVLTANIEHSYGLGVQVEHTELWIDVEMCVSRPPLSTADVVSRRFFSWPR